MNRLYFGDCLTIMEEMPLGSVDLIYLDPPFNSQRDYNAIYKDETGRPLPDQLEAFGDMWVLDERRERELRTMPVLMRDAGINDEAVEFWRLWMNALRKTNPNLLAYLSYLTQRLLPMRGILKPTGSIYLHCDPTASHYIKVMMDSIFGHQNFRNEITWKRFNFHADARKFGAITDRLLFYARGEGYAFNRVRVPYSDKYIQSKFTHQDDDGRLYSLDNLNPPGGRGPVYEFHGLTKPWRMTKDKLEQLDVEGRIYTKGKTPRLKRYLDEMPGQAVADLWADISPINSQAKERMGYATQKPLALLERIISASSNERDVVFDPFCGCATTLEAAHNLKRRWIGIDIAIHAIQRVAKVRLRDRLGLVEGKDFVVDGVPRNMEGASHQWETDKYHFQRWAVGQVDGFVTTKRTADGGIDGRLYFGLPNERDLSSMAIEVKGGRNVGIKDVRELRGVLDSDEAKMAGLIVMHPFGPTKERNIRRFMADAGDMDVMGVKYHRMQVLTVAEILGGKRFHTPSVAGRGLAQPALL